MASVSQRWDAELDRLDASLRAAEEALAVGEDADVVADLLATEPPPDMPALPASHRGRAEATLGRMEALTTLLSDRLAALGTTIARSHRPAASAPEAATARFIDQAV
jgi:hypothetical protein